MTELASARATIERYILGKDTNRPDEYIDVFSSDALLRIRSDTDAVSFAPEVRGRDPIADEIVRRFGQTYENVRTFCLAEPPASDQTKYGCPWLVGMSVKDDRTVRVGWGRYDWTFEPNDHWRCHELTITIEQMLVLPSDELPAVMHWLRSQRYPWTVSHHVAQQLPALAPLDPLTDWLKSVDEQST